MAYTTIPCTYFRLSDGKLTEKLGRALPELVYRDPEAAAAALFNGQPVYVELSDEGLALIRYLTRLHAGEIRLK